MATTADFQTLDACKQCRIMKIVYCQLQHLTLNKILLYGKNGPWKDSSNHPWIISESWNLKLECWTKIQRFNYSLELAKVPKLRYQITWLKLICICTHCRLELLYNACCPLSNKQVYRLFPHDSCGSFLVSIL